MIFTENEIVCPRGRRTDSPMVVDLVAIRRAEIRQDEVATVTKFKAPELLAEFNKAWREINQLVVQLTAEKNQAQKAVDRRRATLTLDTVAETLKEKKIASSADTREAVIVLDAEYQQLEEIVDQIEAVVEFLKGKAKSFENAYTSVKKILGEDSFARGTNPLLSGDSTTETPKPIAEPAKAARPGWGKPRY